MSGDSNLDRDSLQQFLASAFAVQESQIDPHLLSAILELQRLVTKGEIGIDGVMNLVVDSARDVAGAAGVAIGLLEGDQLTFRAGAGCSVVRVGTRVSASLTLSAKAQAGREILRVENAQTDGRIEGAICRQFGAESLLILPICRERALAGVFEVLFTEAHGFADREVRTYRLMVALIEAALGQPARAKEKVVEPKKQELAPEMSAATLALLESSDAYLNEDQSVHFSLGKVIREQCAAAWAEVSQRCAAAWAVVSERCGAAWAGARELPMVREPGAFPKALVQRAAEAISRKPFHGLALAAVATGFGLTLWIAHGDHRSASRGGSSTSPPATAVRSVQPGNADAGTPKDKIAPVPVKASRVAKTRARRDRVSQNDVEYIGDDVTVRHFTYQKATPPRRPAGERVTYIGNDVTVRHFTPKPVVSSESR
jgi:hypothetical protein